MNSSWFELTMEQEFQMRLMEESVEQMTREQMQDLLLETARLLMVKENVLRNVIKSCPL
ncbi:MAG: photosystem I reaction center subunit XII [Hydrococcus sp. CRU_1_1]|jgi:Phycobilisome degradation protein nblA|nr:photosystem I reaction center subunit XII [Hydrococcus sp. CRU_1_1]